MQSGFFSTLGRDITQLSDEIAAIDAAMAKATEDRAQELPIKAAVSVATVQLLPQRRTPLQLWLRHKVLEVLYFSDFLEDFSPTRNPFRVTEGFLLA